MRNFIFISLLGLLFSGSSLHAAGLAGPILIELFTSQGCSSCPPAERVLNTWGMTQFQAKKALPLAFHVDYWDYLGWKDPFSDRAYSDRQRDYASFFNSNSIYTPQMVVAGQVGFNGADQARAQQELERFSVITPPALQLSIKGLQAAISIPTTLAAGLKAKDLLQVVVFENGLNTSIARGENSGATLEENFVVRSLQTRSFQDLKGTVHFTLTPPEGYDPKRSGVAVWFQDPLTQKVSGLTWVYPLSK